MSSFLYKRQWDFLKKLAENDVIPQAMIFSGGDVSATKKIALEFLKILNCQEGVACGRCRECVLFEKNTHPDLLILTPDENTFPAQIHIDDIRKVKNNLAFKPHSAKVKSVIIERAEALNIPAQNSLLKTLEEPLGKSLIILLTNNHRSLLETIQSRCYIVKFPTFVKEDDYLGAGFFKNFLRADLSKKFSLLNEILGNDYSLAEVDYFLKSFQNYLRGALLKKIGLEKFSSFDEGGIELQSTVNLLRKVAYFRNLILTASPNAKLILDNFVLNI